MKIYLVRHASPTAESISGKDIDRPLSIKGFQESALLSAFLQANVASCEVWCSSAVRTCATLQEISRRWQALECAYLPSFYLAKKEILLREIWHSSSSKNLMIIGHNFGLSHLLSYLTGKEQILETAELVELNFEGLTRAEISEGTATIGLRFCPPFSPLEYKYN
jgi:phosphohistidine phosphatase SixA